MTEKSNEVVLKVAGISKRFGGLQALSDVGITIQRGQVYGLIGPNGAGKTTTFRMLCGLLPASSGHLRVAGVDLRTARPFDYDGLTIVGNVQAGYNDASQSAMPPRLCAIMTRLSAGLWTISRGKRAKWSRNAPGVCDDNIGPQAGWAPAIVGRYQPVQSQTHT